MSPGKPNPAKMLLRNEISAKIAALTSEERARQSQIIYNKVIVHPYYTAARRVALYMSTEHEVCTAPLLRHATARGAAAFVPQYAGGRMHMLRLQDGDEEGMQLTKHGIAQHTKDQLREDALENGGLDLIIAPGLAFSTSGLRLGHGGGYYDKYIAKVRAGPQPPKVMALAFNCQVVEEVPVDEMDQKIDVVVSAD